MQVQYQSDYPNQVHQLTIAVSKHFWLRRDNVVRWQKKPFEVNLAKCDGTDRVHVVNYIVRDHFSGAFYAAITRSDNLRSPQDFLIEAWSMKPNYFFDGVPDSVTIAKSFADVFPQLPEFLAKQGVKIIEATSGFQAGVRDVRTWEQELSTASFWIDLSRGSDTPTDRDVSFDELASSTRLLCGRVCKPKSKRYLDERPVCRYPQV